MKRNKNFWSYGLRKLNTPKWLWRDKCLSSTPLKMKKKLKRAQKRGAHLQYVNNHWQSLNEEE